ncbi:MAG: Clp protease N-terminal domain-containing protein [Agriterribacter sp.]
MHATFSKPLKEIISYSHEEALRLGNDFISTEHLFLGMTKKSNNTVVHLLQSLNVNIAELRAKLEQEIKNKQIVSYSSMQQVSLGKNMRITRLSLTEEAAATIRESQCEAHEANSKKVEADHLLLAMLKEKRNTGLSVLDHIRTGLQ